MPGLMPAAPGPGDKPGGQATRRSYVDLDEGNELMEEQQVWVCGCGVVWWRRSRWDRGEGVVVLVLPACGDWSGVGGAAGWGGEGGHLPS
jgi:hypothetical protein